MNYDYYLKRQKINLKSIVVQRGFTNPEELIEYFLSLGIIPPDKEEIVYLFNNKDINNVEERPTTKSSSKKKRVPSSKSSKSKTDDSSSSGGSGSTQRVRKSPTKRQRKRNSDKVEPVQPASGSESSK